VREGERLVVDAMRAENKALKMQLQDIMVQDRALGLMEKVLTAALSGASHRYDPVEACEYAFKVTDLVMAKLQEKAREPES
jgi:hypothetical protein